MRLTLIILLLLTALICRSQSWTPSKMPDTLTPSRTINASDTLRVLPSGDYPMAFWDSLYRSCPWCIANSDTTPRSSFSLRLSDTMQFQIADWATDSDHVVVSMSLPDSTIEIDGDTMKIIRMLMIRIMKGDCWFGSQQQQQQQQQQPVGELEHIYDFHNQTWLWVRRKCQ